MPTPENRLRSTDLLDLICELIELPSRQIGASLQRIDDSAARQLTAIGLIRPGATPKTITCRACDDDHAASPQFDSATGRYFHICPIAGRVEIEARELEALEVHPRAAVDALIAAFPVLPAIGRELVAGSVWHLGEAVIGKTSLTLIFACRTRSAQAHAALADAVAATPATEIGIVVTAGALPPVKRMLPDRYIVLGLRDIASVRGGVLEINRQRLAAHVRVRRGEGAGRNVGGRSSEYDRIAKTYHTRRQRGEPFESIAAEAQAIIAELTTAHRDRQPPGISTIRRHLSTIRKFEL